MTKPLTTNNVMKYEANISPDLRLQILKRDDFICHNCKSQAPLVYLGVKSLIPGKTGENDPANLVTFCAACLNADHGDRIYTPTVSWEERMVQLRQFIESRYDGKQFEKEQANQIIQYVDNYLKPHHILTTAERFEIGKAVHKYGFDTVFSNLNNAYYDKIQYDGDQITLESKNEFVKAISKYAYVSNLGVVERAIRFGVGQCRSKYGPFCERSTKKDFRDYVDDLRRAGYTNSQIELDLKEEVSHHISSYEEITDFERWMSRHKKELVEKAAAQPPQRSF